MTEIQNIVRLINAHLYVIFSFKIKLNTDYYRCKYKLCLSLVWIHHTQTIFMLPQYCMQVVYASEQQTLRFNCCSCRVPTRLKGFWDKTSESNSTSLHVRKPPIIKCDYPKVFSKLTVVYDLGKTPNRVYNQAAVFHSFIFISDPYLNKMW